MYIELKSTSYLVRVDGVELTKNKLRLLIIFIVFIHPFIDLSDPVHIKKKNIKKIPQW